MHRNGLPDDSPGWAVMPARPLCFGRGKRNTPACAECRHRYATVDQSCASVGGQVAPLPSTLLRALLRVYARENHDLRARVEALEWLVEVQEYSPWGEHPMCGACGLSDRRGKIFDNAVAGYAAILHHTRKEAGL